MLLDPRTKYKRPVLQCFINWLVMRPANQAYDWTDGCNCACAQFYGPGDWIELNRAVRESESVDLNVLASKGEWTFGALLKRAQAA